MTIENQAIRNVVKNYGSRDTDMKYGGRVNDQNLLKHAIWAFDFNDLPDAAAHNLDMVIPANSTIVSARLRVITAFTSTSTTTDLTIGLQESDGTEIDNDGLIAAAEATQTAIGTAGNLVTGAGALVGFTIGTADGELTVAPTVDDLLTGRAEVIVEYMTPAAVAA